ncbi:MAG TPA: PQQ-binding-like beta-propeller repeat protein [Kofleriaceae bacterium]|nr:PQQ-binding-like beta-propeller repeat protein [Kofleriaceae bacterium]
MRWVVWLGLLAACGPEPATPEASKQRWVVPPAPSGFPLGEVRGTLGRGQAPEPALELGLRAAGHDELAPLRLPTAWPIPGDGPARAVVFGSEADHAAVELIDVDAGTIAWRDRSACAAPVVGVTAEAIVCADANGTRAIGVDGKPRWKRTSAFLAFSDDHVVVSGGGEAIVLDAASGDELARVKLPRGVAGDSIVASCGDAGRELFAAGPDGKLARIAEAQGGPAVTWAVAVGPIASLSPCDHAAVVVTQAAPGASTAALIALDRATGKITGRVDGVFGAWPARDGSERLEVATARGVLRFAGDLSGAGEPLDLPVLGELLATRGERRLVRATPLTAVVLDRAGVAAYLPLAAMGAVLGDRALLAVRWTGAPSEAVRRLAMPPRWRRKLRVPPLRPGVAIDAELRDLPPVLPLDAAGAVAQPDTGMRAVAAHALDPDDPAAVYAIAVDPDPGRDPGRDGERASVVRADLAARRWRWQRTDGCGPGAPIAIAVARDVVVCATRGPAGALVRATSRDGAPRWDFATESVDGVLAGGDAVAVVDAGRATVLDARTGQPRGHLASDDGAAPRIAVVSVRDAVGDATLVVSAEHGRIVARVGALLVPVWSIAVAGVVRGVARAGAGVLVTLEDGDAYRIDARTAAVVALPGLGLAWDAPGDVVTGHTTGGPIPAPTPPPPAPTLPQLLKRPLQVLRVEVEVPPPIATPIAPPPPLGDAWQLTLFELTGGLRARNDYAVAAPVVPAPRGPAGSPLVVAYGPGLREIMVLDPRTGDPLRRVRLPDDAAPGAVFATTVAGAPVAGALLAGPLRVVLF